MVNEGDELCNAYAVSVTTTNVLERSHYTTINGSGQVV